MVAVRPRVVAARERGAVLGADLAQRTKNKEEALWAGMREPPTRMGERRGPTGGEGFLVWTGQITPRGAGNS